MNFMKTFDQLCRHLHLLKMDFLICYSDKKNFFSFSLNNTSQIHCYFFYVASLFAIVAYISCTIYLLSSPSTAIFNLMAMTFAIPTKQPHKIKVSILEIIKLRKLIKTKGKNSLVILSLSLIMINIYIMKIAL